MLLLFVKMAIRNLTSSVAALQLAAGVSFCENGHPELDKPRHPNINGGGRDNGRLNFEIVSSQFHQSLERIKSNVYLPWAMSGSLLCQQKLAAAHLVP